MLEVLPHCPDPAKTRRDAEEDVYLPAKLQLIEPQKTDITRATV